MEPKSVLAHFAVEYWKLLRGFQRSIEFAPADAKPRLAAQARYAEGRLEALLKSAELNLVTFDGCPFEVNLPAVAVNGEDVAGTGDSVVELTIEPAIVDGTIVVLTGKVLLKQTTEQGHP
jgi:hypothetical protein